MRRFISVACVIALAAAPALAGDGQVSKQSLSRMGLSGMKVVPDQEGLQVRGQSIAITFSVSSGTTILSNLVAFCFYRLRTRKTQRTASAVVGD